MTEWKPCEGCSGSTRVGYQFCADCHQAVALGEEPPL